MAVDPRESAGATSDELGDKGCTSEEVCAPLAPSLLPEVRRRRTLRMCEVSAPIFKCVVAGGGVPAPGPAADTSLLWHTGGELPHIPGYDVEMPSSGRAGMGLVYKASAPAAQPLRRPQDALHHRCLCRAARGGRGSSGEAEAVARLAARPCVVQVHDVGDHEGWLYFTMELLEGGSLGTAARPARPSRPARRPAARGHARRGDAGGAPGWDRAPR